jgi:hypothetical protein
MVVLQRAAWQPAKEKNPDASLTTRLPPIVREFDNQIIARIDDQRRRCKSSVGGAAVGARSSRASQDVKADRDIERAFQTLEQGRIRA